jgi:hypothetical protein
VLTMLPEGLLALCYLHLPNWRGEVCGRWRGGKGRKAIDLAFKLQTKRKRKEEKVSGRRRRMGEKEGVEAELKIIVGEWGHGTSVLNYNPQTVS